MSRKPIQSGRLRESSVKLKDGKVIVSGGLDYERTPTLYGVGVKEAGKQYEKGMRRYLKAWKRLGACSLEEVGQNEEA